MDGDVRRCGLEQSLALPQDGAMVPWRFLVLRTSGDLLFIFWSFFFVPYGEICFCIFSSALEGKPKVWIILTGLWWLVEIISNLLDPPGISGGGFRIVVSSDPAQVWLPGSLTLCCLGTSSLAMLDAKHLH